MTKLKVENFGPIKSVDVSLGDLNILIGPQASGKSLFLELFKLVMDKNSIIETLRKYNYEPTLKSKACLKCLYFTKIISALCCYLEYFSYLYTIN